MRILLSQHSTSELFIPAGLDSDELINSIITEQEMSQLQDLQLADLSPVQSPAPFNVSSLAFWCYVDLLNTF